MRAMSEPRQVKMQGDSTLNDVKGLVTCWHCGKKGHVRRECLTREMPATQFPARKRAVAEVMDRARLQVLKPLT